MAVSPTLSGLLRQLEERAQQEVGIPADFLAKWELGRKISAALDTRLANHASDVLAFLPRSPEIEREANIARTLEVTAKLSKNERLTPTTRAAMSDLHDMVTELHGRQANQAGA